MHRVLSLDKLPFRRKEHVAALEQADAPAQHDAGVGGQRLGQVRLVEPDHPDVARLVPDDGLGAAPAPRPGLLRLPDISHDGLLLPLGQLRYIL